MAQTPLDPNAKLVVKRFNGELVAYLDDPSGSLGIARQADDLVGDHFKWLVESAATFHGIPFEEEKAV